VAWFAPPPVALIVRGKVPVGALGLTDNVSLVVPELTTEDGLNEAVTRFGNPLMLKFIDPENEPTAVTVTVYVSLVFPLAV